MNHGIELFEVQLHRHRTQVEELARAFYFGVFYAERTTVSEVKESDLKADQTEINIERQRQ